MRYSENRTGIVDNSLVVLVVEDEVLVQLLAEETLRAGGFTVIAAASGEQAVELLEAPDHPNFRALVTDINLGADKLTGWDVARHAREVTQDIAVVYMTGDSAGEWTARGVPNSILLTKPFAPAQLTTAVSQLMNAGTPPAT
jgi:CheY-like chemotaxis protein